MNVVRTLAAVIVMIMISGTCCIAAESGEELSIVVFVQGDVRIFRGKSPMKVVPGFAIEDGDTLFVGINSICSGLSSGGRRFEVEGSATKIFHSKKDLEGVGTMRRWISRQLTDLAGKSRIQILLARSDREWDYRVGVKQVIPPADGRVRQGKARFVWSAIDGIDRYTVKIENGEGGGEIRRTVNGNQITIEDLEPGQTYSWQVTPDSREFVSMAGKCAFTVLTSEQEQELDMTIGEVSDLEAGVILLSIGLHEEAMQRFDAAVTQDRLHRTACMWRAKCLESIGLHKEAYKDIMEAYGE